jgi:hypothetical protein
MADWEKAIEHLKEIAEYFQGCRNNASFASKAKNHFWELQNAASEAADLLKAQEPLAVREAKLNKCVCGNIINRYWHPEFCGFCGKKLEWF